MAQSTDSAILVLGTAISSLLYLRVYGCFTFVSPLNIVDEADRTLSNHHSCLPSFLTYAVCIELRMTLMLDVECITSV